MLEDHARLMREATGEAGVEVSTEGNAFFEVFSSAPPKALMAAVAAQRSLAAHPWPKGGSVRVRMGLHTGEATMGGDNYVGMNVHRAVRIGAAGHGGQVLHNRPRRPGYARTSWRMNTI